MQSKTMYSHSRWQKGDKICHVHTTKENDNRQCTIKCTGYNPFPCYSMVSTYHVVAEWLTENGWTLLPGCREYVTIDEISDKTGEVLSQKEIIRHYIPVPEGRL